MDDVYEMEDLEELWIIHYFSKFSSFTVVESFWG